MSQAISLNQSTWASKLKAMGPGILMATAATLYPQLKLAVLTVGLYFSWSS
ncbi:Nramp family metal ion transporter [Streptococcus pneumoniae]|nr:Nramp family metal ion transporter [Streptococcus pneumoniae]